MMPEIKTVEKKKTGIGVWLVAGGLLLVGGYVLYSMLKPAPPEKPAKRSGQAVGATIKLMHRGGPNRVWVGFGIGPGHQDPVTMTTDRWIGGFFDIPAHDELTVFSVDVEGVFPPGLEEDTWVDTVKIILPSPIDPMLSPLTAAQHDRRYDSDWDDEVYLVY